MARDLKFELDKRSAQLVKSQQELRKLETTVGGLKDTVSQLREVAAGRKKRIDYLELENRSLARELDGLRSCGPWGRLKWLLLGESINVKVVKRREGYEVED